MKLLVTLLTCLAITSPLHAADLYRWQDENGRTHISDTVPEKYRQSATVFDTRAYELTAEQQTEAENRAALDKKRAAEIPNQKMPPESQESSVRMTKPKPINDRRKDCATLLKQYQESLDCFAPYRLPNGRLRGNAFQKCTPVPDPTITCFDQK